MAFSRLGDTLRKNIRAAGIEPQVVGAQIVEHFHKVAVEIFGPSTADRMKAMYLKNETLTVAVLSAVVGQELKLHEREILDRLNGTTEKKQVERIRFLV